MLQLNNLTPFAANIAMFPDHHGVDTLYVMVKATFNIRPQWTLVEEQPPPTEVDSYWAEPAQSSLRMPSDFHLPKIASDIVVQGNVIAPEGAPVRMLDVALQAGKLGKTLRIFGDRYWESGRITAPATFDTMPLVYERAFGGVRFEGDAVVEADARNPAGVGFRGDGPLVDGMPLPNIEDPHSLIVDGTSVPTPAGFGFIAPFWQPRASYAGTYDADWKARRAPYLPEDFDPRFFNMAHPDLIYPGFLQGGETVSVSNMHPSGEVVCTVPTVRLHGVVHLGEIQESLAFQLETLLLLPNDLQLSLTWRAAFRGEKRVRKIDSISVSLAR